MTVSDTLSTSTRAAHDVGLAAWLGGAMFGKIALNPSLEKISSHAERGSVANAAWHGYNPINALGLGTAAAGWAAARFTETSPDNLTPTERTLSLIKDGLMAAAVMTGVASGVQGIRFAKQAPDGAVPVESGSEPATDTPERAAGIQRSLSTLGSLNILSGVALVAVNGVLAQLSHSHPAHQRALRRSASGNDSTFSPVWVGSALATTAAAVDQARRQRA